MKNIVLLQWFHSFVKKMFQVFIYNYFLLKWDAIELRETLGKERIS